MNEMSTPERVCSDEPGNLSPVATLQSVRAIAEAGTVEQVWALTVAALSAFGFERVNYGLTRCQTRPADSEGSGNIGDPNDALFLSTHALDEVREHHESGRYRRMPEYRWVIENTGACSWSWPWDELAAGRLSAGEAAAMQEIAHKRRRAGYSVSFPAGAGRTKGAMGLAAADGVSQDTVDQLWREHEDALLSICNMAHFRICQLPMPVPGAALTDRQRMLLEWVADGKSMQDICVLTGLSMSAVEKSLRRARDALMVETTAQAVAKASFLNQMFTIDGMDLR
jgi:DNA-binding CsgD family transcriptional regulator